MKIKVLYKIGDESYKCTCNGKTLRLKDTELKKEIDNNNVENAVYQVYNNKVVIKILALGLELNREIENILNKSCLLGIESDTQIVKLITKYIKSYSVNDDFKYNSVKFFNNNLNLAKYAYMFYIENNLHFDELYIDYRDNIRFNNAMNFIHNAELSVFVTSMTRLFDEFCIDSLDFKNVVTSNVKEAIGMFSKSKIKNLDLSDFDMSSIESVASMFEEATISKIDLSKCDLHNVKFMKSMFNKTNTQSIILGKQNLHNVTSWRKTFSEIELDELDLSGLNTYSLNDTEYAFYKSNIKKLNINIDTHNLVKADSMFSEFKTEELDLSMLDLTNVKSMNCMFKYAMINNIDLHGVRTISLDSALNMFRFCKTEVLDLRSLDFSKVTDRDTVTSFISAKKVIL